MSSKLGPLAQTLLGHLNANPGGLRPSALKALVLEEDRPRVTHTLNNLRMLGHAHRVGDQGTDSLYRAGDGQGIDTTRPVPPCKQARRLDALRPIVAFGASLPAPRVASVWAYADAFKSQAPGART